MALTEVVRLNLESKGFQGLFADHEDGWTEQAEAARVLLSDHMVAAPNIVRKALLPLIEFSPHLRAYLDRKRLTQKYWIGHFTDYILYRVYKPTLTIPAEG